MSSPPKYPRIPHLVARAGTTADDRVLGDDERRSLLGDDVVVEEKLDGANVAIWTDDGRPRVATRGGVDAIDRGGQRGRMRAWSAEHADALREVLGDSRVLYAEWLLARHTTPYERLPGPLVGLDVRDRDSGTWLDVAGRDAVLGAVGIAHPPLLLGGRVGRLSELDELLGVSAYSNAPAEGLIVRAVPDGGGRPRLAKLLAPGWRPAPGSPGDRENGIAGTAVTPG